MKMANVDAVLDFMFTNPKDRFGVRTSVVYYCCIYALTTIVEHTTLFYFT